MTETRKIRVGLLNLWGTFADWPARLEALRKHPELQGLDVLLTQETCVGGGLDQVREVQEALGFSHSAYHSDKTVRGVSEGVAIFSRESLTTVGRTNLGQGRVLITADSYGGVTFGSAHLSFEGRERTEQVKALLKRVTLDRVVLGGDFNGNLATFSKALDHYWSTVPDRAPTWPACGPEYFTRAWEERVGPVTFSLEPQRLDYILTRGLRVESAATLPLEVDGTFVSDHALVTSEMVI